MFDFPAMLQNRSPREVNEDIFSFRLSQNDTGSIYSLEGPFSIAYHHCTGTSASDTYYMLNISANKSNSGTYPAERYLQHQNQRSMHKHEYYELMLVLDGEVSHTIEDKNYLYKAGYGCLVNRSILHTERFIGGAKLLFIGLSPQLSSELVEHYNSRTYWSGATQNNHVLDFINSDLHQSNRKKYLAFFPTLQNEESVKKLNDMAEFLISTALASDFGSFYLICATICQLTQYITDPQGYHVAEMELDSRPDFLLFQRINHLLNDTHGRIARHELEEILNYSGTHINRVVRKYSNLNLFDYSMTFCMKHAEYLLLNTDKSVNEIMSELNFKNPTHFYSIFRDHYGVSPGEYRKKMTGKS